MKKIVCLTLLLLLPVFSGKAQQRDIIRLSCGVAGCEEMPHLTMFDADFGYEFAFSRHFGLSLGGSCFNYYKKESADYGHNEEKHQLVSFLVGLNYTPLIVERHHLALNFSVGPGFLSELNRKILYYDTGPYYVNNNLAFGNSDGPKTVMVPVVSLALDYLAFVTDHLGIGASVKTTYFAINSLRFTLAWRL